METENRDERIRHEIQFDLRWMPRIDPDCVEVAVENGVVTLKGQVADASDKKAVGELARRVPGVKSVANEMQIRTHPKHLEDDARLTRAVHDAFGRGEHEPL